MNDLNVNLDKIQETSNLIYTNLDKITKNINKINEIKEKMNDEEYINLNSNLAFLGISIEYIYNRLNYNSNNHNPISQIQKLKEFNLQLEKLKENNKQ